MKIRFKSQLRSGYALLTVLVMILVATMILGGTLKRTYGVANMNSRAVDLMTSQNAAEAAVELVFSRMQWDFQSGGGLGTVITCVNNGTYQGLYPNNTQDSFWSNFQFSDGTTPNKTYVAKIGTFNGNLPNSYSNRTTVGAPIYRIMSNARRVKGPSGVVGTAQEDVILALIPLTAYAIFYNGLLEFSTCATMKVNGSVHSNTNIYVGAGGGATLTFNTTVTATGIVEAPPNNGASWGSGSSITNYNSSWSTTFNGPTNFVNNLSSVQVSINMTNTHSLIDVPTVDDSATILGQQRLYNQAQIILTVSNLNTTDLYTSNVVVAVKVQKAPDASSVPGADTVPTILAFTNPTIATLTNNFPFLSLSNLFYDKREGKTNITTQIDLGKYKTWLTNASSPVVTKFPADGSAGYPTILFINDTRNTTTSPKKMDVVRITNGVSPPPNGGLGFSIATPNPLYILGHYNQTVNGNLGTTNTATGTVPCALMSDALTILSANWSDSVSMTTGYSTSSGSWDAQDTTVNAAILTGIVPSTGTDSMHFSGGVHNLPRLLQDWSSRTLTLNTSIINLYNSSIATGTFVNPGTYYNPPTRNFSYDLNFSDPTKVPPGIPCALVALRYHWATPPPKTTSYNVTP